MEAGNEFVEFIGIDGAVYDVAKFIEACDDFNNLVFCCHLMLPPHKECQAA